MGRLDARNVVDRLPRRVRDLERLERAVRVAHEDLDARDGRLGHRVDVVPTLVQRETRTARSAFGRFLG